MPRSLKKGPFVKISLEKKISANIESNKKEVIKGNTELLILKEINMIPQEKLFQLNTIQIVHHSLL